jgi:polyisoprenoid-binding protein YceI
MNQHPGIDLRINGKNLLLLGNFNGWQSRLVLGPDLDDVGVSLFVDTTSVRAGDAHGDDIAVGDRLFSFRSRSVEALGKGRYRVVGDFTGAEPTREIELNVETPMGHTALIALSFEAQKKDFGDNWGSLVENTTLFGSIHDGEGPQREAAAWLRAPNVAAA